MLVDNFVIDIYKTTLHVNRMGLMDIIKKFSENRQLNKEKFKQAEQDMLIQKKLEERQKSANERELERFIEEKREANIKIELDKIRKIKTKMAWKDSSILNKGKSILNSDKHILGKGKSVFTKQNIFLSNKLDSPLNAGGSFF